MNSPEFAAEMAGFTSDEIVEVQSVLLDPTPFVTNSMTTHQECLP